MSGRRRGKIGPNGKYVIVNDCDAPEPRMVCQWVPCIGYCYLDRRLNKPDFDGMSGIEATAVDAFGWTWAEDEDGGTWVRFYRTDRPSTAKYPDGAPRRWQNADDYFEFRRLGVKVAVESTGQREGR